MKKIFWLMTGFVSAFFAGMYLYEGVKLFFRYRDMRTGLVACFAGCAVIPLFVWSMMKFFNVIESNRNDIEDVETLTCILANIVVFGCALAGVILHFFRFGFL